MVLLGTGQNRTTTKFQKDKIISRVNFMKILFHEDKFARGDWIARRQFWAKGHVSTREEKYTNKRCINIDQKKKNTDWGLKVTVIVN